MPRTNSPPASVCRYFWTLCRPRYLEAIRRRHAVLVIDGSSEAAPWHPAGIASLNRELEAKGLPLSNVLLLTGNARAPHAHASHFQRGEAITVLYHNVYFAKCARLFSTQFGPLFPMLEAESGNR